ncbi:efflux RND transporter periplasmic adaptor subunit [Paenibacillus elgii]|uniref:efflux RND transporter periplasmic adaptor subunit n=1 Tax=Paenibacillus elgii TaxID=189691 RepID=UPI000FDAC1FC|nr:biotin/lipoyl-binding protein [Paenibacillus elgii]NEN85674.1 biotin/lipoyl-binding protein [Paenibacillus elgii]
MGPNEEPVERSRKRKLRAVFGSFIALLVLFTLFGNTLQSLTLPKVRTEKPTRAGLVYTLEGSGNLKPIAEAKLTNPGGWKVKAVHVKEGDRVAKGQALVTYDSSSAERELQDEKAQLEKQQIELQNTQDRFIVSAQEADEMKKRSVSRDLEKQKIDLGIQERKIKQLEDRLASQKEISAPFDGMITKLNAVVGLASAGEPDVVITNESRGYRFEFIADAPLLTNLGISLEDKVQVEVQAIGGQQPTMLEGAILELADAEPRMASSSDKKANQTATIARKVVRVKVAASELKGGEQAWVKLTKRSQQEGLLISNEAIHEDRAGKFIYKVEERKGALGDVFIVRKVQIRATETNDKVTKVPEDGSVYEGDLIILESSEPLQDGNRVRLQ